MYPRSVISFERNIAPRSSSSVALCLGLRSSANMMVKSYALLESEPTSSASTREVSGRDCGSAATVGLGSDTAVAVAVGIGVGGTGVSATVVGAIGVTVEAAVRICVAVGSASDEHAVADNALIAMTLVANDDRSMWCSEIRIIGWVSIIEGAVSTYERGYSVDW